jgi:hypothetical protein
MILIPMLPEVNKKKPADFILPAHFEVISND